MVDRKVAYSQNQIDARNSAQAGSPCSQAPREEGLVTGGVRCCERVAWTYIGAVEQGVLPTLVRHDAVRQASKHVKSTRMPELISIPFSFFEATFTYKQPNLGLWLDRMNVVRAVFAALQPWHLAVDNIEVLTVGKPSEQGIKFKLPEKQSSFFFGPSYCKFSKDNADWPSADETIAILDAALSALIKSAEIEIAKTDTAIALHMQPKTLQFTKILAPLIPGKLAEIGGEVQTAATVIRWRNRTVLIDASVQVANGIFMRFERSFEGKEINFKEIGEQLHTDEDALFAILDVKEDLT